MVSIRDTFRFIVGLPRLLYALTRTLWFHHKHAAEIDRKAERFNAEIRTCSECSGFDLCDDHEDRLRELTATIGNE